MSTLKPYHINKLQAQTKQIQREHNKLRELIRLGDMHAVEESARFRKNIEQHRDKVEKFRIAFHNTDLEVFLYALSTLLNTLLDSHQNIFAIKEQRASLPWKREALSNIQKLNLSKKTPATQISNNSSMKSHSQSKSRLSKSLSEKTLDSRQTTRHIINEEKKQKRNKQQKQSEDFSFEKSSKKLNNVVQSKENLEWKPSKMIQSKSRKLLAEGDQESERLVTIKIGKQEFEEIIKIKNSLISEVGFDF